MDVNTHTLFRWFMNNDKWPDVVRLSEKKIVLSQAQRQQVDAAKDMVRIIEHTNTFNPEDKRFIETMDQLVKARILSPRARDKVLSFKPDVKKVARSQEVKVRPGLNNLKRRLEAERNG